MTDVDALHRQQLIRLTRFVLDQGINARPAPVEEANRDLSKRAGHGLTNVRLRLLH